MACCRRIQHLFSETRWQDCLNVAERYADRRAKRTELAAACPDAPGSQTRRATYAHLLRQFGETAVRWACETKKRVYAAQVAMNAACVVAYSALPPDEPYVPPAQSRYYKRWAAAETVEEAGQITLLYEVCGSPFRPVTFNPAWRTSDVVLLARGIYDERAFDRMPILADAIQDAGCDNDDVLDHCRDTSLAHVRGCWVVDAVLEKE